MTAVCIDVTRLMRRAALPNMTGIDRVEYAYLSYLLGRGDVTCFGLARVGRKFCLLDRDGLLALRARTSGAVGWGTPPFWVRMSRRHPDVVSAERYVSTLAVAKLSGARAAKTLATHLPKRITYVNTGHSNLTDELFTALSEIENAAKIILIHDTIPLDFPEFQRRGMPEKFAERLKLALIHGDRIVVPSTYVKQRLAKHAATWSLSPRITVAPLGIDLPTATSCTAKKPYFVTVGTIEPRKNHALLLDLWKQMPEAKRPTLYVVGRRGWENQDVFKRLDAGVPGVVEFGNLDDGALAALLTGASGLLHPSFAEGFGLPPHEAAARGVVPVCAPLPVYQETLGKAAIYADPSDLYKWRNVVLQLLEDTTVDAASKSGPLTHYSPPSWRAHFKDALTTIC